MLFGVFGMEAAFGKQTVVDDAVNGIFVGTCEEGDLSYGSSVNGRNGDNVFVNMEEGCHEF